MAEKCYLCGKGRLTKKKVNYEVYGVSLGRFLADVCNACNETFFDETISRKMTELAKKRGIWGLHARTKIGQAGTTLDIRLPKKIISFLDLKKGKEVEIYPEGKNKLVVTIGA